MGVSAATTLAQNLPATVLYYQNQTQASNISNTVTAQSSQLQSDSSNQHKHHSSYAALMPWAKGWQGFLTDFALSCFTYFLTYVFLGRHFLTPLAPQLNLKESKLPQFAKNLIDYAATPIKMPSFLRLIESKLTPEEKEKFQKDIVLKLHEYSPNESKAFWTDYFEKYILNDKETFNKLSKADRFAARFSRQIYGHSRRWSFASLIAVTSLIRAFAVNPHLPWSTALLILGLPFLTNSFFGKADRLTKGLGEAQRKGLSELEIEKLKDSQQVWQNRAEIFNFWGKIAAKCSKRITPRAVEAFKKLATFQVTSLFELKDALMLLVAFGASTASRLTRDLVEAGIKDQKEIEKYRNPFMRFVVGNPITQSLRKFKLPIGENKDFYPFQKGLLSDFDPNLNHTYKDSWRYIGTQVGIKSALKYFSDSLLFGIIGITALKTFELIAGKIDDDDENDKSPNEEVKQRNIPIYAGLTTASSSPAYAYATS